MQPSPRAASVLGFEKSSGHHGGRPSKVIVIQQVTDPDRRRKYGPSLLVRIPVTCSADTDVALNELNIRLRRGHQPGTVLGPLVVDDEFGAHLPLLLDAGGLTQMPEEALAAIIDQLVKQRPFYRALRDVSRAPDVGPPGLRRSRA